MFTYTGIELLYSGFMIGIGLMCATAIAIIVSIIVAYVSGKLLKEY